MPDYPEPAQPSGPAVLERAASRIEPMVLPSECAEILNIRVQLVSAVKRALDIRGRKVFVSQIQKYLKENPEFVETDVYVRKAA